MSAALGALAVVGWAVGILLILAIILLAVFLTLPVGVTVGWSARNGFALCAWAGFLRRQVYPRPRPKRRPKRREKKGKQGTSQDLAKEPNETPGCANAASAQAAPTAPASSRPSTEPPVPPGQSSVPSGPEDLPDTAELEEGDPSAMALLGMLRLFWRALEPRRKRILRGVMLNDVRVFWTVIGEDAADTAVCYGRRIALCNTLLAFARDRVRIRASSLRLEPDFLGTLSQNRFFSCQIRTRPYIMVLILLCLLRRDARGKTPLDEIREQLNGLR